ncbi:hypothetical protein KAJ87_02610 [Candidatus Pacearchaeota archaeon]|nr:hypothetical protein [Candidatus Pacearchaeota archaeon]
MKGTILIIGLLMVSVFAGMFVFAETENVVSSSDGAGNGSVVSASSGAGGSAISVSSVTSATDDSAIDASEIETTEIETEEVEELLEEVEAVPGFKRVGFAKTWRGQGWISNDDEGHLVSGFWASQRFAKINTADNEVEAVKTIRAFGRLRIAGAGVYRLIRAPTTEEIESATSVSFYVIPMNKKVYAEESELARDSVGKLVLTRREALKGLTIWDGTLNFESGNLQGSWDVELGTDVYVVRPAQIKKIKAVIGKIRSARVRINEAITVEPQEISETGEETSDAGIEIQIKPIEIKRHKIFGFIPTNRKVLEVEITDGDRTYRRKIKANKMKKIRDYAISVGSLEDEDNIEISIE